MPSPEPAPGFYLPRGIAVEATGGLVVVDRGLDKAVRGSPSAAVVRVDPVSGDRTIVSDDVTGAGPAFTFPFGIAVEATGDLVVTDGGRVVRVDPLSGGSHDRFRSRQRYRPNV